MNKRTREDIEQDRQVSFLRQPYGLYDHLSATVPGGDSIYKFHLRYKTDAGQTTVANKVFPFNHAGMAPRDGKNHKALLFIQNFICTRKFDNAVEILCIDLDLPQYQSMGYGSGYPTECKRAPAASFYPPAHGATYFQFASASTYSPHCMLTTYPFNQLTVSLVNGSTLEPAVISATAGQTTDILMDIMVVLLD